MRVEGVAAENVATHNTARSTVATKSHAQLDLRAPAYTAGMTFNIALTTGRHDIQITSPIMIGRQDVSFIKYRPITIVYGTEKQKLPLC